MTTPDILEKLKSKKSADRRSAAKTIGKLKLTELGVQLFEQYLIERNDSRTWETQVEMIKALGKVDFKNALPEIELIVRKNIPHDMITIVAATTYVQLKRNSVQDASPVLELLAFGSVSIIHGALLALAVDKMMPGDEEIKQIMKHCRDINKHPDRIGHEVGLMDSRQYLAIACANWNPDLTKEFLQHCIDTSYNINSTGKSIVNQGLMEVCQNSFKGKFSKEYLP